MVRKLALALICIMGTYSGSLLALGLGSINLNSYLNQPLDAEIELLSAQPEEMDQIKATLPTPAEFARVGIDYQPYFNQLRFNVKKGRNGKIVIKITSQRDFREPFLNFLVEVNWAKGRLLRQYTVLLDPPVLVSGRPQQVQTAQSGDFSSGTISMQPTPVPKAQRPTRTVAARPAPAYQSGEQYGPIQRNETLWTIAKKVRPDQSVSIDQVMIALLNENPNAFLNNNINQLRAGQILRVPDMETIQAMTHREAVAENRRQYKAWRSARTVAEGAPTRPAAEVSEGGRLELLAAGEDASEPSSGAAAGTDEGVAELKRELALAKESAEAGVQQNAELRSRLSQLEDQIENLERLASLKDDQLAELQQTLARLRGEEVAAIPEVPVTEAAAEPEMEAQQPAVSEPEEPTEPMVVMEDVPAQPASADAPINPYAVNDFQPVDVDTLPKTAPTATPGIPAPVTVQQPAGMVDRILALVQGNLLVIGIVGGVLLILALMLIRQRNQAAGFNESILEGAVPEELPSQMAPEDTLLGSEQVTLEGPSSGQLSDFAISGVENLQSEVGEADPLTEADVFMAYGRFEPAETMIKEAIEQEPGRVDLRVKLLEIFYAAKNSEAFATSASDLYDSIGESDPNWNKVAEMGQELCPENAMFQGQVGAEPAIADSEPSLEELDLENALGSVETPFDDQSIEFDLGDLELDSISAESSELPEELEMDLDSEAALDIDIAESVDDGILSAGEEFGEEMPDSTGTFEMDVTEALTSEEFAPDSILTGEATLEQEEPGDVTAELSAEHEEFQMSLDDDLDSDLGEQTSELDYSGELTGLDETGFTLETTGEETLDQTQMASLDDEQRDQLEAVAEKSAAVPEDIDLSAELDLDQFDSDLEVGDGDTGLFSAVDEISTKLDLARAYIDMGDPDGAKSILDEVIEEGNNEQQGEANELMQKIS